MFEFIRQKDLDIEARALVFFVYLLQKLIPEYESVLGLDRLPRAQSLRLESLIDVPENIWLLLDGKGLASETIKTGLVAVVRWYCFGGKGEYRENQVLINLHGHIVNKNDLDRFLSAAIDKFVGTWIKSVMGFGTAEKKMSFLVDMLKQFSGVHILFRKDDLLNIKIPEAATLPVKSGESEVLTDVRQPIRTRPLNNGSRSNAKSLAASLLAGLVALGPVAYLSHGKPKDASVYSANGSTATEVGKSNNFDNISDAELIKAIPTFSAKEILNLDGKVLVRIYSNEGKNSDRGKGTRLVTLFGGAHEAAWKTKGFSRDEVEGVLYILMNNLKAKEKGELVKIAKERLGIDLEFKN